MREMRNYYLHPATPARYIDPITRLTLPRAGLTRLRGFEGRNRLGGVKNGFESQKSALQSRLRLTRCDGDPGRRLGRQLQLQSLQEQFQIRLRLRISA